MSHTVTNSQHMQTNWLRDRMRDGSVDTCVARDVAFHSLDIGLFVGLTYTTDPAKRRRKFQEAMISCKGKDICLREVELPKAFSHSSQRKAHNDLTRCYGGELGYLQMTKNGRYYWLGKAISCEGGF